MWAKLDDGFPTNPKVLAVTPAARLLYIYGLCFAAKDLTDGHLSAALIPALAALTGATPDDVVTLVNVGLWAPAVGGYQIHDWHQYNPSADAVKLERELNSRRNALHRDGNLTAAVRDRDGDWCRYCGVQVRWTDRRGSDGGTYDHVDPYGPNTLDNLAVACRACNAKKLNRTPDQAGMVLAPPRKAELTQNLIGNQSKPNSISNPVPVPVPDPVIVPDPDSVIDRSADRPSERHLRALTNRIEAIWSEAMGNAYRRPLTARQIAQARDLEAEAEARGLTGTLARAVNVTAEKGLDKNHWPFFLAVMRRLIDEGGAADSRPPQAPQWGVPADNDERIARRLAAAGGAS